MEKNIAATVGSISLIANGWLTKLGLSLPRAEVDFTKTKTESLRARVEPNYQDAISTRPEPQDRIAQGAPAHRPDLSPNTILLGGDWKMQTENDLMDGISSR